MGVMTHTNAVNFQNNMLEYLRQAASGDQVVHVNTEAGDVVLLNGEEYSAIMETLHLVSIPGMKEKLLDGFRTPVEERDRFEW